MLPCYVVVDRSSSRGESEVTNRHHPPIDRHHPLTVALAIIRMKPESVHHSVKKKGEHHYKYVWYHVTRQGVLKGYTYYIYEKEELILQAHI